MQYLTLNELKTTHGNAACALEIIGVPCNQFGLQEPGENEEEVLNGLKYVRPGKGYEPNFPLTKKIDVNGKDEDKLYTFLKDRCPVPDGFIGSLESIRWSPVRNDDVSWNFEKVLVDHNGQPYRRYSSPVLPEELKKDIEDLQKLCRRKADKTITNSEEIPWY